MGFSEAISTVFSKYAVFEGRARRSEYWYFTLFNVIVEVVLGLLLQFTQGKSGSMIFILINAAYSLAVLIPSLAVAWRRLHDIGKPGYFYFIGLIPLVGTILMLIWYTRDSEPGTNMYGPNPKENTLY